MEITLLGWITIIISIYAFFKDKKLLLYIMVFLSTFTAVNLIHITMTTTPVLTYEFTGAMWLLRELVDYIKTKPKFDIKKIVNKFKENKIAMAFLFFIVAIILSEVYLAITGMNIEYTIKANETGVISFSKSNIKQAGLAIYVFIIMIVLSFRIKTKEEVKKLIKVFCISSIFAIIWGLMQFITYYIGIPYPAFLFNNNPYAMQWYEQIDNNIKRISSIALEPSMFAINLIAFLPFVFGLYLKKNFNLKNKKMLWIFILTILTTVCAILTTSSTTYVGLVTVYALFLLYCLFAFKKDGEFDNRKKSFKKIAIATFLSIAVATGVGFTSLRTGYALGTIDYIKTEVKAPNNSNNNNNKYNSAFDNIIETIKQMTVGKLMSGSGQERMEGERIGRELYKYSPIFGIGFGTFRTFSLFTNVLTSMGIIRNYSINICFICCN